MPTLEGLDPAFRAIIDKIIAESGGRVTVVSGFRSREEQQRLYDAYQNGTGNLAAPPGQSKHEHGFAVDFGGDLDLAAQLAEKYGLVNSVQGEPWHFTMGGEGNNGMGPAGPGVYDRGENTNPQDVLANRLQSILRIIGQDDQGQSLVSSPDFEDEDINAQFKAGDVDGAAVMAGLDQPAGSGVKGQLQKYARKKLMELGMSDSEMAALIKLWNKESGWNPQAQNPSSTAYGIAQFLNSTWAGTGQAKTSDPYQQIDAGLTYINNRYGSPSKALEFHLANNFY